MPIHAPEMPDAFMRAPWLQQRLSFALALFGAVSLAYAALIAGNWYIICADWSKVSATFLRSQTYVPIRRDRSVRATLLFTYGGIDYRVAKTIPRATANALLRPRFDGGDVHTVTIKIRPESPRDIVVDPRAGIFSALKWGVLLLAAAAFVFKKGDLIARKLHISEAGPSDTRSTPTKTPLT